MRLFTRNGNDWSNRFPLITDAALRNRINSFVINGEAVLLGVDGRSDFNGLRSRKHNDDVQCYAFDVLALEGEDLRPCRCIFARPTWRGCWRAVSAAFFFPTSNKARSAPIYSVTPA